MSAEQYQKILGIAEALLRKVEMPDETIQKYSNLKNKILTEPCASEDQKYNSLIKEELLGIYDSFFSVIYDYFNRMINRDANGNQKDENSVQIFFEEFDGKKKEIRDVILDCSAYVTDKASFKEYLGVIDEMEGSFEKVFQMIGVFEEMMTQKIQTEEQMMHTSKKLEEELADAVEELKNNSAIVKEAEALKIENESLEKKIKDLENRLNDLQDDQDHQIKTYETKLEQGKKERDISIARINKLEFLNSKFIRMFEEYAKNFKGPQNFESDEEIFEYGKDLVRKLENDNKWMIDRINQLEEEIKNLFDRSKDDRRGEAQRMESVEAFITDLQGLVRSSDKSFMEVQETHEEVKAFLDQNFKNIDGGFTIVK